MDNDTILDGLNAEQYRAVTYDKGSILVLAGAGSGKTRVLTTRMGWLITQKAVRSNEILAVTFTNKAAKEMSYRVSNILKFETSGMWIGTFHSVALRLLSRHNESAGLPTYFQILDSQDQLNILKRIIKSFNLDEERYSAKELQKFINQQKENGLRSSELNSDNFRHKIWLDLYTEYETICNRDGLVDFTELLLRSYEMLSLNSEILDMYRMQFRHILIDEFQDTNKLQYKWLQLLAGSSTILFAVGDDDQSIYSFRGAQVSNMQSFIKDYAVIDPIRLEQNYRSTTNILHAANAVIGNNLERIGKKLWTSNHGGDKIKLYEGYTEEDEAYYVCDEIKSLHNHGMELSDMAILYRSNAQSRVFEQLFYSRGIPYKVYGGLRFFDRQEIKHVLAYLRLMLNFNDNEAFLRVVNVPPRGIGARTIENLQLIANENQVSLYEAVALQQGKSKANLSVFTELLISMKEETKQLSLSEIISYLIEGSGLADLYRYDKKGGVERLENLNELVNAVTNFRPDAESENIIASFLAYAVLESAENQAMNYENSIQLMTVHAAKGLEFKAVFVVGLEDGLFPHENCFLSDRDLEEERRLMYVAITRAKERLYLLRACSRLMWGKRTSAPVSRFVGEIPGELISNISGISKIGSCSLMDDDQMTSNNPINHQNNVINNPESKISRVSLSNQSEMVVKIGDMVRHAKFGKGKVINLNIEGTKITADIFFIGVGKKTLDLNIAKIEKV